MNKNFLTIILIFLGILLIVYLKNKGIKRMIRREEFYLIIDKDYKKVKIISANKCSECNECLIESNGCCYNCNLNTIDKRERCLDHDHFHHHEHQKHSHQVSTIPTESFLSFLSAIFIFCWVIKKIILKK